MEASLECGEEVAQRVGRDNAGRDERVENEHSRKAWDQGSGERRACQCIIRDVLKTWQTGLTQD